MLDYIVRLLVWAMEGGAKVSLHPVYIYISFLVLNIWHEMCPTEDIQWPDEEDWQVRDDAKDMILSLLLHDPLHRLGTGGAQEVKEHEFFASVNWETLLRQKAEFVPQLDNEEDTSYFDSEWHETLVQINPFLLQFSIKQEIVKLKS